MCKKIEFKMYHSFCDEIVYILRYNSETYFIHVKNDGEFHNKLYKCKREIPPELQQFVEMSIREDLEWR